MSFLSPEHEPVRRYIYGVAVAILAVGVLYGVVTAEASVAIGAVISAALLVPTAEAARAKVRPVGDEPDDLATARHLAE